MGIEFGGFAEFSFSIFDSVMSREILMVAFSFLSP